MGSLSSLRWSCTTPCTPSLTQRLCFSALPPSSRTGISNEHAGKVDRCLSWLGGIVDDRQRFVAYACNSVARALHADRCSLHTIRKSCHTNESRVQRPSSRCLLDACGPVFRQPAHCRRTG